MQSFLRPAAVIGAGLAAAACAFTPPGLDDERARAAEYGAAYDRPFEERALPDLPAAPGFEALWQRTLWSHGELEAAWHAWRASLAAVVRAASWPNTNVALDVEYGLSTGELAGVDAWDRTTLRAGFDPMQNLWFPEKLETAGATALAEARAAGERFRSRRFALKRELAETWTGWLGAGEEALLLAELAELDELERATRDIAQISGGEATRAIAGRIALARTRDELARTEAARDALLATLNGLCGRAPAERLAAPAEWPARTVDPRHGGLERLAALARERDPARGELAAMEDARAGGVAMAEQEGRIDVNPMAGITGSVETFVGAAFSLPLNRQRVRALVEEARERLAATRAEARQLAATRGAALAAAWRAYADAERSRRLYVEELLPLAARLCDDTQAACAVGGAPTSEWIDARRVQVEARRAELEARVAREEALARIEELVGVDLEALEATEVPENAAEVPHGR